MKYLTAEQVLFIHSRVIDETGGAHGVRDVGLLQSAVSPQATFGGSDLYPDLFTKAAALIGSLALNHPFIDGNKRTAFVSFGLFLEMNGHRLEATQKDIERFVLQIAIKKISDSEVLEWIAAHAVSLRK